MIRYWVYILRCSDGSYYTGSTAQLEERIKQHMIGGGNTYTVGRRPVELVFAQEFQTFLEARSRERQIKGWSRKKKEALFLGDWDSLVKLSKSKNHRP